MSALRMVIVSSVGSSKRARAYHIGVITLLSIVSEEPRPDTVRRWPRRSSRSRSGSASSRSRIPTRCCSRRRAHEARPRRVLPLGRRRASSARCASGRRSCGAFPTGSRASRSTRSACPEKRPEWVEAARVTFPSGRHADELCVTELAQVVWAANLAVDRLPSVAVAARRHRASGRAAHRHRPAAGHDFADGKARRRDRARGARRDRLRGLAEDVGQPRHPRRLPDRAALGVPGRPPLPRWRSPARSSGALPSS